MTKLTISGWDIEYEVSIDGRLKIGFHSSKPMSTDDQQKVIAIAGKYLVDEGYVTLPGN